MHTFSINQKYRKELTRMTEFRLEWDVKFSLANKSFTLNNHHDKKNMKTLNTVEMSRVYFT